MQQRMVFRIVLAVLSLPFLISPAQTAGVAFERVLPLQANEGVFAYARISPSGRYLAYASEMPNPSGRGITQTETVVDLNDKKVLFREPGIDGYFSNDGERLIFLSFADRSSGSGGSNVAMRHMSTGDVIHGVAPVELGDYFSWSVRDGKNVILTIQSNFYALDGDHAVLPAAHVTNCPGIGTGERPLISKDGKRITTFIRGNVWVRGLTDCSDALDTGLRGAKADFSWDSRYVSFHVAKADRKGSEIVVIDTKDRTVRTLTGLAGDAVFPSWTQDGRLCFRYDGSDYRGFMIASNVLSLPARPLTPSAPARSEPVTWQKLFPNAPLPAAPTQLVMIWSDWSPHAPNALAAMQTLHDEFAARHVDVGVSTAVPPASRRSDIDRILSAHAIQLPEIGLSSDGLQLTGALNQIPTTLLFRDGVLVEQRLGPQSYENLKSWLAALAGSSLPLTAPKAIR